MAYDFESGEIEQIVTGKLPSRTISKDFSWHPDMTRGVQEIYDILNGVLYWITPFGSEPISLTLSDGKRSWSLDESFPDFSEDSSAMGIAAIPAWSPDGKTIAFWASFDAIGREGFARADGEYNLIFLDPDSLAYTIVLDRVCHPEDLEWSPNSEWLAFLGETARPRRRGLWLFSLRDKKLVLISEGVFRDNLVWSPDGRTIAGILCYDNLCEDQEIWEYDVSELTSR
jgi:hypothetical protein